MLGSLAEDEAKEDVETSDGEDKECRHERKFVNVMRQDGSAQEALDNTQRTQAKRGSEDGKVSFKEPVGP